MPVQRTPPGHLQPQAASHPSSSQNSYSSLVNTPSKGAAPPSPFGTRKSALLRTPPHGGESSGAEEVEQRSAKRARLSPPVVQHEQSTTPTQPVPAPRRTSSRPPVQRDSEPAAVDEVAAVPELPAAEPKQDPEQAPVAETIPAEPIDYGRHHRVLLQALEVAVRKGANKWTADDLKACFPILSSANPKGFEDVWATSAQKMRETILMHAQGLLEDYKAGPLLKLLNEVVEEARAASDEERLGVWRPDVSPQALAAANNLPIYDDAYSRLRDEHETLFDDSSALYDGLQRKRAELSALEKEIKEAVGELDGTLGALEDFPSVEMLVWTEDVAGHLEHQRAPDRTEA